MALWDQTSETLLWETWSGTREDTEAECGSREAEESSRAHWGTGATAVKGLQAQNISGGWSVMAREPLEWSDWEGSLTPSSAGLAAESTASLTLPTKPPVPSDHIHQSTMMR